MTDEPQDKGRSGRKPHERFWVRSVPIRAMFRPAQAADLRAIAREWGVPVASVVWAIVHEQLRRYRRLAPDQGAATLAAAAAYSVTRRMTGKIPAPTPPDEETPE